MMGKAPRGTTEARCDLTNNATLGPCRAVSPGTGRDAATTTCARARIPTKMLSSRKLTTLFTFHIYQSPYTRIDHTREPGDAQIIHEIYNRESVLSRLQIAPTRAVQRAFLGLYQV